MPWSTPKTNWTTDDPVTTTDLNRIEGNIDYTENSLRTPVDNTTVSASAKLGTLLNYFATQIKKITGKAYWYNAPSRTLEDLNSHIGSNSSSAHPFATRTAGGFMSSNDKLKLDGIQAGAQVNQPAFSYVNAGGTNWITAGQEKSVLEMEAGSNMTIEAVNGKLRFTANIPQGVKIAQGYQSSISDVVGPKQKYTYFIYVGFPPLRARVIFKAPTWFATSGAQVYVRNMLGGGSVAHWVGGSSSPGVPGFNANGDVFLGGSLQVGASIYLESATFNGNYITLTFYNEHASSSFALQIKNLLWEAEG